MNVGGSTSASDLVLADNLHLPLSSITETFAILANRGSGKSATAHRLVEQMHRAYLPVVVLDIKGDWWGIRSSADGKGPGLPFVIFGGDHGDVPLEPTAGELLADLIVDDRVPAVLDLSHMSKTRARAFTTTFAERLYTRNRDPLHLLVEEADVLIPQRAAADTARLLGAMEDLAKRGRSRGIGLTVVTQRPQEVSKSVLELMETVILLRMTGPRSIKAAQDWIRVNAADDDTQASEVIATLPSLETGEAWVWSPAFLRLLTRTRIALFETFDSHATPEPGRARIIPKSRADIDLEKLSAEIAATAQRAKDNDPAALRRTVESLSLELDAARADQQLLAGKVSDYEQQLATKDDTIAELADRIDDLLARPPELPPGMTETLHSAAELINTALTALDSPAAAGPPRAQPPLAAMRARPRHVTPPRSSDVPTPAAPAPAVAVTATGSPTEDVLRFRAGAVRMLESLGRMAPLRLTNAQWGTVAKMKHTSGTWSTYLRELRRAGLLDETPDGTTLSDAGFAYLGGRPAPMTGRELQQHYLKILRAGAGRMLQALINAYPHGLTREEISEQAQIAATSGTFSTYLRELLRNGLVTDRGGVLVAGDILMHGADAGKEGASA
ncbi:DUF87 domain-containing protein [Mycobacterium avium subsp. hominissuis]|uniref:Helicase HerA central domain-containing protein n=3 Tax=Mycobacterium TaxID=1763 RepID=A0A1X1XP01_9MYCO|nr:MULTISPECIES: DUF87 domain-containing protein [Mycobacterium]MBZ4632039.1 DUF87 domain-containing protein [Mycobacterium avium subsp. hominissuis]ORW00587.1 hypothetical protein AWC14_10320 [Mycobacterium kyorinense]PBJ40952.1 DUF87 domain-containing protein [Mycobacterium avium subsp. hominissuis]PBJ67302.1 DUF87 domain-containing protein [Mycobacterium avium subsp. hominissuis]